MRKYVIGILICFFLLGITGCKNQETVDNDIPEQEPTYQINLNENISVYQTYHSTLCGGWMFPLNAEEILGNRIEMTDAGYPRINVGSIEIAPHEWDEIYPQYGFSSHKGYGTAKHIQAIKEYGPCPLHRKSFITHFV